MPVGALIPAGLGIADAVAGGLTGLGIGAETAAAAAPIISSTASGAALGAGESALFGGNPLLGALGGGAGGIVSEVAGPAISSATGIGSTASEAIGGALGGATSSAIQGSNPITGAALGAGTSLLGSALSPSTGSASGPMGTGAGSSGAAGAPGPAGGGVGAGGGGGGAPASPASAAPVTSIGASPPSSTDTVAAVANTTGGKGMDLSSLFGATDFTAGTPFAASLGFGGGSSVPVPTNINTPASAGTGGTGSGIGSTIGNWLMKNPGVLLGGALLGGEALFGNNTIPGLSAVQQTAGQEKALAGNLLQGIQTGAVPPGAQAVLDQLTNSMKAKVQGQYASLGLSGSTMEAQDLAKVDQTVAGQKWNIINSLLTTGVNELGQAGTLDQQIMQAQVQQDQELQRAIAAFAGAVAGGGLKAAA